MVSGPPTDNCNIKCVVSAMFPFKVKYHALLKVYLQRKLNLKAKARRNTLFALSF